jgi:hypothetical protein
MNFNKEAITVSYGKERNEHSACHACFTTVKWNQSIVLRGNVIAEQRTDKNLISVNRIHAIYAVQAVACNR